MTASNTPPVATLLGRRIEEVNPKAGFLRAAFDARRAFSNPARNVQGGMLCAMLDDLMASLMEATLDTGQSVATLNLNVSFLRPSVPGAVNGEARFVLRGREICHVAGVLLQKNRKVASATAVFTIAPAISL